MNRSLPLPPGQSKKGKKAAPMMDIYALEADWRAIWRETGRKPLENHNAAFVGFCKSAYSKR